MAREDGKVERVLSVINMMEIIAMTRNTVMGSSLGLAVIFIKGSIRMMKEMALER